MADRGIRYRAIFDNLGVALWEEDVTDLLVALERLQREGVEDVGRHLTEHPEVAEQLASGIEVLAVNKAALELYEADDAAQLCTRLDRLLVPESLPVMARLMDAIARGDDHFEHEVTIGTTRGNRKDVHISVSIDRALQAQTGRARAHVAMVDISRRTDVERQLVERTEALRDAERRYHELYDTSPDLLLSVDHRSGRVLACNQTAADKLGYRKDELVGRHMMELYHEASIDAARAAYRSYREQRRVRGAMLTLRSRRGGAVPVSLSVNEVMSDDQQEILYLNTVWRDMSERKQMEAALAAREALYRTLIEALPDPVWLADAEGSVTYINEAWTRATGQPTAEALGAGWAQMVHGDDLPSLSASWEAALARADTYSGESRFTCAGGGYRTMIYRGRPVHNTRGEVVNWVGINTDVTEQRAAAAAVEAMNESLARSNTDLERFAYVASHDLQEPLRMVASFCQLLERNYGDRFDERGQKWLGYAVDGARRMQGLVRGLLRYSRVDSRAAPPSAVDAGAALRAAVQGLSEQLDAEAVEIGELPQLWADPAQLQEVFHELLDNAVGFADDARPLRVAVQAERDGDHWRVSVRDNGIGIPAKHRERVFEIFRRLDPRGKRPGTGLGLALSQKIVRRHGGELWVAADGPAEGSELRFTWPMAPPTGIEDGDA